MKIGYCASCEQFAPSQLLEYSLLAEECGFQSLLVSDHFQPWTPQQGHSSMIWVLLGALGSRTSLDLCSGVCAPGPRWHPALLAQAAITMDDMFPGRFRLGLGAGEALNDSFTSPDWPTAHQRVQRLLEAIDLIYRLWNGEEVSSPGPFFPMQPTRLYPLRTPEERRPLLFTATSGPLVSRQTGQLCDGIMTVGASPDKLRNLLDNYAQGLSQRAPGAPAPALKMIQIHVSWADTDARALSNALLHWPNGGMNFPKGDIKKPEDIASLAGRISPRDFKDRVVICSDPEKIRQAIAAAAALGFNEVFLHNCGPNQDAFLKMCAREVVPLAIKTCP